MKDSVVATLINGIAGFVPSAISAIVGAFANPLPKIDRQSAFTLCRRQSAGVGQSGTAQTRKADMQIPLSDAIQQLRDELREAILEGKDKDIVFTPNGIDIELAVSFGAEAKVGGGFKLLAFLDLSTEAKLDRESQHKIKLSLSVADKNGQPIKVRSESVPKGLPK